MDGEGERESEKERTGRARKPRGSAMRRESRPLGIVVRRDVLWTQRLSCYIRIIRAYEFDTTFTFASPSSLLRRRCREAKVVRTTRISWNALGLYLTLRGRFRPVSKVSYTDVCLFSRSGLPVRTLVTRHALSRPYFPHPFFSVSQVCPFQLHFERHNLYVMTWSLNVSRHWRKEEKKRWKIWKCS